MRKRLIFITLIGIYSCKSAPPPKPVAPPRQVKAPAFDAAKADAELAKVTVYGFERFKEGISHDRFDEFGERAAATVEKIVAEMPQGYKIEIVGHARSYPSMVKEYVERLSVMRAKYVFHYFIRKGLPEQKLTFIGVGDAEPDSDAERSAGGSVSFRLTQKTD